MMILMITTTQSGTRGVGSIDIMVLTIIVK